MSPAWIRGRIQPWRCQLGKSESVQSFGHRRVSAGAARRSVAPMRPAGGAPVDPETLTEPVERQIVCIVCPIGCRLTLRKEPGAELEVSGHRCPRGVEYAREEFYSPTRTVTATCATSSAQVPRVPVRTDAPIPVEEIAPLLTELYAMLVEPPIERGQVIVSDYRGTGVNVVATRSVPEAEEGPE